MLGLWNILWGSTHNSYIKTLFVKQKKALEQGVTRQSEMANTSPRHMPVLGNVHPIKIENFATSFLCSPSFYIFNL